jgi:hypothetical protein
VKRAAILIFVCLAANVHAARFLFDADHGESAGNADWVIDADLHNLSWTSAGTFTTSSGNESNAQRIPTPPASNIVAGTSETYWSGAISAWAVDLVKRGHSVETLPAGTTLTYNTANAQDLTNYDVVIIDEPNVLFASTEKQALINFVQHGGSLFMISDHAVSDRNGDGQDSVTIWNDFLTNNGLTNNPFGITFRTTGTGSNSSGLNTFNHSIVGDPILNGPVGMATNMEYFNGNEFQIDNTKNPTVISQIWFGLSSDSNNFCGLASLQYGNGRVVVCGDSSCIDDGTGDSGDSSLFDGYTTDAGGVQHIWILNASEWLAAPFAAGPVASVGVTNITPSCGPTTGGTAVTITGSNFLSGATVLIGGVSASNVVVVSSNTVTALTPTNAVGAKIVSVTNTNGSAGALANGYTYVVPPSVPAITIPGTGFCINAATAASFTVSGTADSNITIQIFANATLIGATTADGAGNWTTNLNFNVTADGPISLTAVAANSCNSSAPSPVISGTKDATAPTFAGLDAAIPAIESATLTWSAAVDSNAVTYQVFQSTTSGAENFGAPTLTTNSLSVFIAPLYPGSNSPITYFFIVRATDSCGNADTNIVEKSLQPLLDPNKSQVGDGIPNGWKQQYGLNPFDPTVATGDADGDGMSNLQEFLAGTDPTNPASAFRITSVVRVGTDVNVTWTMGPGKTNALQSTAGAANGAYQTNGFVDLFIVTNTTGTVTNYPDPGAATNSPSRFYRIRLVP